MSEVRAQIVDRLGSFRLSDGVLEVALVKFTSIETGDWWVQRVVDYLPDGMQHPANRMVLPPPSGWEPDESETASTAVLKQR